MSISFSTEQVDLLIAPGISKFRSFDAPELIASYPEARHWLANHFLNTLVGTRLLDKHRQWALNQIFRAEIAFRDYHEARELSIEFIEKSRPDHPAIRTYFKTIAKWESCLINIQIFFDLVNKVNSEMGNDKLFEKNDGSPENRAYEMANTIKHWGGDIALNNHEPHHTIPIWLCNEGLSSRTHNITYIDLASIVREIANVADALQDIQSFKNRNNADQDQY